MQKPPAPTMPGMTDTLEFVKNLWGSMNIPGTGMPGMSGIASPTLSTDDLDKRIADLKAVESWLNMNVTMLRGTIQTMEVQRGTLAALKSMSASMADAMRQSGVGTDKMGSNPFAAFFNTPAQPGAAKPTAGSASPATGASLSASAGGGTAQPGAGAPAGSDAGAGNAALGMPGAVAWWNMLQNQFQQAVTSAMSSQAPAAPDAAGAAAPGAAGGAPAASPAPDAKAASPSPAPTTQATPAVPKADANGEAKARASKSRADKA